MTKSHRYPPKAVLIDDANAGVIPLTAAISSTPAFLIARDRAERGQQSFPPDRPDTR